MELNVEYLKQNGFETNHPERVLSRYVKRNAEYRISVEQSFIPLTDSLSYNIDVWKYDERGAVVKKVAMTSATQIEEFDDCLKLCNVNI